MKIRLVLLILYQKFEGKQLCKKNCLLLIL